MTDRLGPMTSRWAVLRGIRDEIKLWLPEYMAAYERESEDPDLVDEQGHATGATAEYGLLVVRQSARFRPADATPSIVVWLAGVTDHELEPSGVLFGTLQVGIATTVTATGDDPSDALGDVAHRFGAALTGLLLDHPTCSGTGSTMQLLDEDYSRVGEDQDLFFAAADLSYEVPRVVLGKRGGLPPGTQPREDPRPPWEPAGTFEHVTFGVGHIADPPPVAPFTPVFIDDDDA